MHIPCSPNVYFLLTSPCTHSNSSQFNRRQSHFPRYAVYPTRCPRALPPLSPLSLFSHPIRATYAFASSGGCSNLPGGCLLAYRQSTRQLLACRQKRATSSHASCLRNTVGSEPDHEILPSSAFGHPQAEPKPSLPMTTFLCQLFNQSKLQASSKRQAINTLSLTGNTFCESETRTSINSNPISLFARPGQLAAFPSLFSKAPSFTGRPRYRATMQVLFPLNIHLQYHSSPCPLSRLTGRSR